MRRGREIVLLTLLFGLQLFAKECVPEQETRAWGNNGRDGAYSLNAHPGGRYLFLTGDRATWMYDLERTENARRISGYRWTKPSSPSGDFVLSENDRSQSSTLQTFSSFQGSAPVFGNLNLMGRTASLVEIERSANQVRLLRVGIDTSITEIRATLNDDGSVGEVQLEPKGNLCSTIVDPQVPELSSARRQELEGQIAKLETSLLAGAKQLLALEKMRDGVSDRRSLDPKIEDSSSSFKNLSSQLDSALRQLNPGSYRLPADEFSTDGEWVVVHDQENGENLLAKVEGNSCHLKQKISTRNQREVSFRKNSRGGLPQKLDLDSGARWTDLADGREVQLPSIPYASFPTFLADGRIAYLNGFGNAELTLDLVDPNQKVVTSRAQKEANCITKPESNDPANPSTEAGQK